MNSTIDSGFAQPSSSLAKENQIREVHRYIDVGALLPAADLLDTQDNSQWRSHEAWRLLLLGDLFFHSRQYLDAEAHILQGLSLLADEKLPGRLSASVSQDITLQRKLESLRILGLSRFNRIQSMPSSAERVSVKRQLRIVLNEAIQLASMQRYRAAEMDFLVLKAQALALDSPAKAAEIWADILLRAQAIVVAANPQQDEAAYIAARKALAAEKEASGDAQAAAQLLLTLYGELPKDHANASELRREIAGLYRMRSELVQERLVRERFVADLTELMREGRAEAESKSQIKHRLERAECLRAVGEVIWMARDAASESVATSRAASIVYLQRSEQGYQESRDLLEKTMEDPAEKRAWLSIAQQGIVDISRILDEVSGTHRYENVNDLLAQFDILKQLRLPNDPLLVQCRVMLAALQVRLGDYRLAQQNLTGEYAADNKHPPAAAFFAELQPADLPMQVRAQILHAEIEREIGSVVQAARWLDRAHEAFAHFEDKSLRLKMELSRGRLQLASGEYSIALRTLGMVAWQAAGKPLQEFHSTQLVLLVDSLLLNPQPLDNFEDREAFSLALLDLATVYRTTLEYRLAGTFSAQALGFRRQIADDHSNLLAFHVCRAESLFALLGFRSGIATVESDDLDQQEVTWRELRRQLDASLKICQESEVVPVRLKTQVAHLDAMFYFNRFLDYVPLGSPEDANKHAERAAAIWDNLLTQSSEIAPVDHARILHFRSRLIYERWRRQLLTEYQVEMRKFEANLGRYRNARSNLATTFRSVASAERVEIEGSIEQLNREFERLKQQQQQLELLWTAISGHGVNPYASETENNELTTALNQACEARGILDERGVYPLLSYAVKCNVGEIALALEQSDMALPAFESAIQLLDQVRMEISDSPQQRARFWNRFSVAFDRLIDFYAHKVQSEPATDKKALLYAEKKRNRMLSDRTAERFLVRQKLQTELHNVRDQLQHSFYRQDTSRAADQESQHLLLTRQRTLQEQIRKTAFEQEQAVENAINELILLSGTSEAPGRSAIYYHLSGTGKYAFLIFGGQVSSFELRPPAGRRAGLAGTLNSQIVQYRSALSPPTTKDEQAVWWQTYNQAALQLGEWLFPNDLRTLLLKADSKISILVFPDSTLYGLPLEALRIPDADADTSFVIDRLPPIAYQPSIAWYCETISHPSHLANDQESRLVVAAKSHFSTRNFGQVSQTTEVARRVAAMWSGTVDLLLDDTVEPTKKRPTVANVSDASVKPIHHLLIATHGNEQTDGPALILESEDGSDAGLTVEQIEKQDLTACELVTLLACSTLHGKQEYAYDMPLTICTAYLQAGARRVLASASPVQALHGSRIVDEFLTRTIDRPDRAVDYARALRDAKAAVRHSAGGEFPYLWAPLVLFGPPQATQR
ncbi:MAG: CHAT domain-containing protein [Planctomycetales bacterium]|nr:CHAT domain-containing protein [Planctomycetales bacterium]